MQMRLYIRDLAEDFKDNVKWEGDEFSKDLYEKIYNLFIKEIHDRPVVEKEKG